MATLEMDPDSPAIIQDQNIKNLNNNKYQYRYLTKQTIATDQVIYCYPIYEIKPIDFNIPEVYYKRKVIPKGPPEPNYLQKIRSRNVDPDKLSKNQKKFVGKTLFEKDMIIIQSKNQQIQNDDQHSSSKKIFRRSKSVTNHYQIPPKNNNTDVVQIKQNRVHETSESKAHFRRKRNLQPPDCFYRDEENRKAKNEKTVEEIRLKKEHEKRQEQFIKHKFKKSRKKTVDIDLDSVNLPKESPIIAEKEQELMEKNEEMKHPFRRPTKSSLLRTKAIHNRLEIERSNQKNEEKMQQLKNERLKKHTKRLAALIVSMNPCENPEVKARQRKEELKKLENNWNKWLVSNQQSNAFKETMLEKTYNMTD